MCYFLESRCSQFRYVMQECNLRLCITLQNKIQTVDKKSCRGCHLTEWISSWGLRSAVSERSSETERGRRDSAAAATATESPETCQ